MNFRFSHAINYFGVASDFTSISGYLESFNEIIFNFLPDVLLICVSEPRRINEESVYENRKILQRKLPHNLD